MKIQVLNLISALAILLGVATITMVNTIAILDTLRHSTFELILFTATFTAISSLLLYTYFWFIIRVMK